MRVLIDTSIWINHIRKRDAVLDILLLEGLALIHPFVIGELALGQFKNRENVLDHLQRMPKAIDVIEAELLHFIDRLKLFGTGIGLVDAHLLASAKIMQAQFWSADICAVAQARRLGIEYVSSIN